MCQVNGLISVGYWVALVDSFELCFTCPTSLVPTSSSWLEGGSMYNNESVVEGLGLRVEGIVVLWLLELVLCGGG